MKYKSILDILKNYTCILIMVIGLILMNRILMYFDSLNIADSYLTNAEYSLEVKLIYPLLIRSCFLIGFTYFIYKISRIKSSISFLFWNGIFMFFLYCIYIGMYYLDFNIFYKYLYNYLELPLLFLFLGMIYLLKYLSLKSTKTPS